MALKTYVLLPALDADAPVYQKTADGGRIQVTKIPVWRPFLRIAYQDEKGIGKVIRYKANAVLSEEKEGKTVDRVVLDQREQIDKLKIDANEPFTRTEMRDLEFKHGVMFTNKLVAQEYLEAYPGFQGFKGTCEEVREPQYKLLDEAAEALIKNSDTRKRIEAASKVLKLNLDEAQSMLIRLNGSYFETPKPENFTGTEEQRIAAATGECQNMLWSFIDDAEEAGLDAVLMEEKDMNIDDKTTILIGKLLNNDLLAFDALEGKISKKDKDGKWIPVREMSDEYSLEERKRLFSDFLNTEDGKALKTDLEKDLKAFEKAAKKQTTE